MNCSEGQSQRDLLIPDGYPELIFVLNGAYQKEYIDLTKSTIIIDRSCFVGMQTQTVLASRLNHCYLIGLKLHPLGAYRLFGERLKRCVDINQPLADFGIPWLLVLDESLRHCSMESSIIDLLSKSLLQELSYLEEHPNDRLAAAFLASVLKVKGQISVQELAQQHYLSVRHFQRKFKNFFGVSPKKFLNIIRFKHLYKSSILQHQSPRNFLDYGYYDQMHFIKDFQKHLGVSPSKSLEPFFRQLNQMAKRNA